MGRVNTATLSPGSARVGPARGRAAVTRLPVRLQAANELREAILLGEFAPGQRLTEAELCVQLGVSRASLREALRSLEAEKLITITPNRGPAIAQTSWEEAAEIYAVRGLLEGEAAELFAERATRADVAALRDALVDFERAAMRGDAYGRLAATNRFYDIVLGGCGNRIIRELLNGLLARITFLRARSMSRPGRSRHSAAELRKILQAIERGDARAARAAAVAHVQLACAAARQAFQADAGI
jgi:DNA-binding GntR family transcriptional regulator